MSFQTIMKQAFGEAADTRLFAFLTGELLPSNLDHASRWADFIRICEGWRKAFLVWEEGTYVEGLTGYYNLNVHMIQVRLSAEHTAEYLLHMTILAYYRMQTPSRRFPPEVLERTPYDFHGVSMLLPHKAVYTALSQREWLEELEGLYQASLAVHQAEPHPSPEYQQEMEPNYSKFRSMLTHLNQNTAACDVVRMNNASDDGIVWYFAKDTKYLYITLLTE